MARELDWCVLFSGGSHGIGRLGRVFFFLFSFWRDEFSGLYRCFVYGLLFIGHVERVKKLLGCWVWHNLRGIIKGGIT